MPGDASETSDQWSTEVKRKNPVVSTQTRPLRVLVWVVLIRLIVFRLVLFRLVDVHPMTGHAGSFEQDESFE